MALSAVGEFHRCDMSLQIRLPRPGKGGLLEAKLTAERYNTKSRGLKPSVSRSVPIFGGDPTTVVATIFRLVYDVDRDCGSMWAQEELFKQA